MQDNNAFNTRQLNIDKLIEDNYDKTVRITKKFYKKYVQDNNRGFISVDDFISAALEGLVRAANNYDENSESKFFTYAYKWIEKSIIQELSFYIGHEVLFFKEEDWNNIVSDVDVEDEVITNLSKPEASDEDKDTVLTRRLGGCGLTEEEILVYTSINGIGRDKANYSKLSREIGKMETDVRRIYQKAEGKLKHINLEVE